MGKLLERIKAQLMTHYEKDEIDEITVNQKANTFAEVTKLDSRPPNPVVPEPNFVNPQNLGSVSSTAISSHSLNSLNERQSIPQTLELPLSEFDSKVIVPSVFTSPWTAFRDSVERVWGLLQAKGTRTVHLVGDGQRVATHFTARDASQLKALADSGAKAYPSIRTLGVIPVLPDTVMLEFTTQSQAQA